MVMNVSKQHLFVFIAPDADTLGSLIDPRRASEQIDLTGQTSLDSIDWDDIAPLLEPRFAEETDDPTTAVPGANAQGLVRR